MSATKFKPAPLLSCLLLAVLLAACGSNERKLEGQAGKQVDFSGCWELDYSQSDNIQAKLDAMVRELRRQVERRNRAAAGTNQSPGASLMVGAGGLSGESIMGVAQMATNSPLR